MKISTVNIRPRADIGSNIRPRADNETNIRPRADIESNIRPRADIDSTEIQYAPLQYCCIMGNMQMSIY